MVKSKFTLLSTGLIFLTCVSVLRGSPAHAESDVRRRINTLKAEKKGLLRKGKKALSKGEILESRANSMTDPDGEKHNKARAAGYKSAKEQYEKANDYLSKSQGSHTQLG